MNKSLGFAHTHTGLKNVTKEGGNESMRDNRKIHDYYRSSKQNVTYSSGHEPDIWCQDCR